MFLHFTVIWVVILTNLWWRWIVIKVFTVFLSMLSDLFLIHYSITGILRRMNLFLLHLLHYIIKVFMLNVLTQLQIGWRLIKRLNLPSIFLVRRIWFWELYLFEFFRIKGSLDFFFLRIKWTILWVCFLNPLFLYFNFTWFFRNGSSYCSLHAILFSRDSLITQVLFKIFLTKRACSVSNSWTSSKLAIFATITLNDVKRISLIASHTQFTDGIHLNLGGLILNFL
jgi:hypothetical protein